MMKRREFLRKGAVAASLPLAAQVAAQSPSLSGPGAETVLKSPPVRKAGFLIWLDGAEPALNAGTTWGQAWPRGSLKNGKRLQLINADGKKIPLQSWPTAYWPDGSVKWTAHAVPANSVLGTQFRVEQGDPTQPKLPVIVRRSSSAIAVDTGVVRFEVPTQGEHLVAGMYRGKQLIAKNARLIGLVQDAVEADSPVSRVENFISHISSAEVEQEGPVRSVIKLDGVHRAESGREWLPFSVRLYFYAGAESLRIAHTFVYDGDDQKDFIRGLGLRFDVVQRDDPHNRHVRFVGEGNGLWGESPLGITGLRRDPGQRVRDAQIAGIATPPTDTWDARVADRMHWIPVWNDYTLSQLSANGFSIRKRTKPGHAWIDSDQGRRASGVAYLGGVSGGVLFGMRDFWQLHPGQIDIRNAGAEESQATLWFWSPEAPPMDVRFYHDGLGQETYADQLDALNITYEDYEPGFGSAVGVARTTEFVLSVLASTPSRENTIEWSDSIRTPPQVVAAPEDYLSAGVFGGLWTLPDRSTPIRKAIEARLSFQVDYYRQQVEQRHWYGFWNYGDIMHSYDVDRHVWRYDVGGYAWDNSELSPDLWLWYSFLRTGDVDTFRLAEAMTRHNRDVDIYHLGRFKGLGTRHNVQHWGCSAKQLRISTAAYRRFHYYLTGDERTGDVLNEVISADKALAVVAPGRKVSHDHKPGDVGMGVGTDWGSVAANWLTAWERTGDARYRDQLLSAMRAIGSHPQGFFAGGFGYDPQNKQLIPDPDRGPGVSHLSAVFGLVEVNAELNQLLDVPEYRAAWLRYCRLYNADEETQQKELGKSFGSNLRAPHSRLTAYAAAEEGDPTLARRAWEEFETPQEFARQWGGERWAVQEIKGPLVLNPVIEAPWLSTNDASQWGLAAIQNLALVSQALDE